jgi:hypothetical protein
MRSSPIAARCPSTSFFFFFELLLSPESSAADDEFSEALDSERPAAAQGSKTDAARTQVKQVSKQTAVINKREGEGREAQPEAKPNRVGSLQETEGRLVVVFLVSVDGTPPSSKDEKAREQ